MPPHPNVLRFLPATVFLLAGAVGVTFSPYDYAFIAWSILAASATVMMPVDGRVALGVVSLFLLTFWLSPKLSWVLAFILVVVALGAFSKMPQWCLWAAAVLPVAVLSGGTGSAQGWNLFWIERFGMTPEWADHMVWLTRKTIHVVTYGFLAWSFARDFLSRGASLTLWFAAAVWSMAHGAFDEFRQAQTPGRTGSVSDFGVNVLGVVLFLSLLAWLHARSMNKAQSHEETSPAS